MRTGELQDAIVSACAPVVAGFTGARTGQSRACAPGRLPGSPLISTSLHAGCLLKPLGAVEQAADKTLAYLANTALFNITGQPAMSVPIGMQFVGRFGEDATLFRFAGQLERAARWFDRLAPGY